MAPPPFDSPDARAPAEFAGGARAPSPVAARPDGQLPHGHRRRCEPMRDSVPDATASVTSMALGDVVVREADGGVAPVVTECCDCSLG